MNAGSESMGAGGDGGAGRTLTFAGLEPGVMPWTLLGFVLLSAAAHGLAFFIFQSIYPSAARVGPPPAQVSLLMPGTPAADGILRWMDADDPSLAAAPDRAAAPGLDVLRYVPSYSKAHARPALIAAPESPLPYPAGVSGLDLVKAAAARPPATAPQEATAAAGTMLEFSSELPGVVESSATKMAVDGLREGGAGAQGELRPGRYLLGVEAAEGAVRYLFLQESSGDKGLDEAAGRVAEGLQFAKDAGKHGIVWGFVTFYWGPGVYRKGNAEESGK